MEIIVLIIVGALALVLASVFRISDARAMAELEDLVEWQRQKIQELKTEVQALLAEMDSKN